MATKYAGATNTAWSAMTWLDGPSGSVTTAPGVGDTVELNNKIVQLDSSVTVSNVTNALGGYLTTGSHTGNRTLTANLIGASSTRLLYVSQSSGNFTLNGNVGDIGGVGSYTIEIAPFASCAVSINGSFTSVGFTSVQMARLDNGVVSISGNISGTRPGIYLVNAAGFTLTGNVNAGTSVGYARGIEVANSCQCGVVIIGNVVGGGSTNSVGVYVSAPRQITITGNITGGTYPASHGVSVQNASATVTITGSVTGGSISYVYGVESGGTVTINGDVTAGNSSSAYGVNCGNGTLVVNGNLTPSAAAPAIFVNYSPSLTINGTVTGGTYGPGNTGGSAQFGLVNSSSALVKVRSAANGPYGYSPISGPFFLLDDATTCTYVGRKSSLATVTLTNPAASGDYPTVANVRSGVSYAAGNLTGTLAVPAAGSVALGVQVDHTTGTAVLTAANVTAAIDDAIADAIASIAGSGPNQVDVIVSSSAGGTVQGVSVRIKATGLGDHTATTNSSGVARFNLPSGTWNLTASLNGYSYSGSTQVISTNPQEVPITMTVTSVSTPSSPSKSVGVLLCLDTSGDPESGVTVSFQMVAGPGDDGYSLDAAIVEEDCDSEGVLEREFLRGATYDAWRGVRGARVRFVVPDTASFNLPEQLGVD